MIYYCNLTIGYTLLMEKKMAVRVCRWGHSAGVRISTATLEAAGLQVGRMLEVRLLDNGEIRLKPVGAIVPALDSASDNVVVPEPKVPQW